MAKMVALHDNFDTIRSSIWSYAPQIDVVDNRLRIAVNSSYRNITTIPSYDLTNSRVRVKVDLPPIGGGTRESYFDVTKTGLTLSWIITATTVICRVNNAGSVTDTLLDFEESKFNYLGFRNDGSSTYFEYSEDGWSWKTARLIDGLNVNSMKVNMYAGAWGAESTAYTYYSRLNLPADIAKVYPRVEIAFENVIDNTRRNWVDVSQYVRSIDTSRGRNNELDDIQTGQASIHLMNPDGIFTAGNAGSPYYQYLVPGRPVRITTTVGNNLMPANISHGNDINASESHIDAVAANSTAFYNTVDSYDMHGSIEWDIPAGTPVGAAEIRFGSADFETAFSEIVNDRSCIKVKPNSNYCFAAKVLSWGDVGSVLRFGIRFYDANGNWLAGYITDNSVSNGKWKEMHIQNAPSPANARYARCYIRNNTVTTVTNYVSIDAIRFNEGNTRVQWVNGSGTYSLFTGYIDKWPSTITSSGSSEVTIEAYDEFSRWASTQARSVWDRIVMAGNPVLYLPLTEPAEYSDREPIDDSGYSNGIIFRQSSRGWLTYSFGNSPSMTPGLPGSADTKLHFPKQAFNYQGQAFEARGSATVDTLKTFNWSIELWATFAGDNPEWDMNLFTMPGPNNENSGTGVYLDQFTGKLGFKHGIISYIGSTVAAPSLYRHIVLTSTATSSSTATISLYLDGVLVRSEAGLPTTNAKSTITSLSIGGAWLNSSRILAGPFYGDMGYLTVYGYPMSQATIQERYSIGKTGKNGEYDGDRIRWAGTNLLSPISEIRGDVNEDALQIGHLQWSDSNLLEVMKTIAKDGGGYIYIDGNGDPIYHNRTHYAKSKTLAVFADRLATAVEPGLEFVPDQEDIRNDVSLTRRDGAKFRAINRESVQKYGTKRYEAEVNIYADADIQSLANQIVNQYGELQIRCEQVRIKGSTGGAALPQALKCHLGSKIRLEELPSHAPSSSMSFFVQQISHRINASGSVPDWEITFSVSPAENVTGWAVGDPTDGILGVTTRLI
jgi:hypothetical protein